MGWRSQWEEEEEELGEGLMKKKNRCNEDGITIRSFHSWFVSVLANNNKILFVFLML